MANMGSSPRPSGSPDSTLNPPSYNRFSLRSSPVPNSTFGDDTYGDDSYDHDSYGTTSSHSDEMLQRGSPSNRSRGGGSRGGRGNRGGRGFHGGRGGRGSYNNHQPSGRGDSNGNNQGNHINLHGGEKHWAAQQELKIKITRIPKSCWTYDVYTALSKYGTVVRVEMQPSSMDATAFVVFQ
jgi:hypothetical protein